MFLSWASGPSSPWYRPQPDPGAPRNATQYGDAVDVAPAMGLPVLLLSPTAAAHQYLPTDAGRQLRPHCRGPDLDRHNGRNLHERHRRHLPRECCEATCHWPHRWGCAHPDGTSLMKRAHRSLRTTRGKFPRVRGAGATLSEVPPYDRRNPYTVQPGLAPISPMPKGALPHEALAPGRRQSTTESGQKWLGKDHQLLNLAPALLRAWPRWQSH